MFEIGTWNCLSVISEKKITLKDLFCNPDNFIICINERINANKMKYLLPSESTDIVYDKLFYQKINKYFSIIGQWNGIEVLCHIDDMELLQCPYFNMECRLIASYATQCKPGSS